MIAEKGNKRISESSLIFKSGDSSSSSCSDGENVDYQEISEIEKSYRQGELPEVNQKEESTVMSNFETTSFDSAVFSLDSNYRRFIEIGVKIAAVFILMILIWYLSSRSPRKQKGHNFCLDDRGHDYLDNLNKYIHENKRVRHFLEISSSVFMDSVVLNLLYYNLIYGLNGYGMYMTAIFYGCRGIVQSIFTYRFPKGGIWDDPGFPSITVPYGLTCDFYISGHCGFTAANAYYMWMVGRRKTAVYLMLGCCYLAFILVLFRIHYTLDIPIGIFFGIYSANLALFCYRKFDRVVRNLIGKRIVWMYNW